MWGVISNVRLVLGKLSGGIIFNINIFKTCLEERADSTKVKLDGAKVNFREVFHSVHTKIFKASRVVGVNRSVNCLEALNFTTASSLALLRRVLSSSFLF